MAKQPGEDPLVAKAFGAGSQQDLEQLIGQLDPTEAEYFLKKLEAALRKRKIMLSGYIVAMVAWLVGMVCAIAYFGMAAGFTAWVFLVPFAIVGAILYVFGALANKAGKAIPEKPVTPAAGD